NLNVAVQMFLYLVLFVFMRAANRQVFPGTGAESPPESDPESPLPSGTETLTESGSASDTSDISGTSGTSVISGTSDTSGTALNLAVAGAVLYAMNSYACVQAIQGKESSILALLMVLSFACVQWRRWLPLAWLSAIIVLTRPEGLFWLAVAFAWSWKKQAPLKVWIGPLALLGVYYGLTQLYFGSIIPHGAFGRLAMMQIHRHLFDWQFCYSVALMARDTTDWLLTPLLGFVFSLDNALKPIFGNPDAPIDPLALPRILQGLMLMGIIAIFARSRPWLRFYLIAMSAVLAFQAFSEAPKWPWYYAWFGIVPVIILPYIFERLCHYTVGKDRFMVVRILAIILIVNIAGTQLNDSALPFRFWDEPTKRFFAYRDMAEYLNQLKPPAARVATYEPGIFGYYYKAGRILDLSALVSDEPRRYYPPPRNESSTEGVWGGFPPQVVLDLLPDWLICLDSHTRNGLLKDDRFFSRYKLARFYPNTAWGAEGLVVYKKQQPR
ncbi:MAG TPA: hypothetical protein V6C72_17190, partial [Chroococcales cyanobacterium]